ncbi:MAG: hypothetical protein ACXVPU_13085 [Bacteroidia bacterium]
MKKLTHIYFIVIAIITISLMFWDYNNYPFSPGNNYIGNPPNALLLYPLLVFLEFVLILFSIRILKKDIRLIFKIGLSLLWFSITFISFIDTMRGGGVLAVHALWLLLVSISLAALLIINLIQKRGR